VPIDRALRLVAAQQRGKRERAAALSLEAALREGRPLSAALAGAEAFYGSAAVAAARAGESSGTLGEALGRYVEHLRRQAELRRKLSSAVAYPITVLLVACAAMGLMLGLVVPRLSSLLDALGGAAQSPLPTRALMALSGFVRGPALFWGAGLSVLAALILFWPRRSAGSLFSRALRHAPGLGAVVQQGALARACATLSALLKAGVPLPEALQLCGPASGNIRLAALLHEVSAEVSRGLPMSFVMRRQRWLGLPLVAEAAALGEETGALSEQMDWVARELESRSNARSATLLALLEPALIVMMALIVGLVAASLFLPVLSLAERAGG
jgi:type IV pilus assembly protein PilC